jgi:hypothetical protein
MMESRCSAPGACAYGARRPTRLCLFLTGLLFTLPLNVVATPFCNATSVYCLFADPPGQFEWPGAGVCKANPKGGYEFCLLPSPQPAEGRKIVFGGGVVQPTLDKSPIPLSVTVTEMFWRLIVFAWLTVCVAGFFLLSRKVVRKTRSILGGTSYVAEPARLPATLVFIGAIGTAMVIFGGAYQFNRLHQVEIGLENRAVAESDAQIKCQRSSGIVLPDGEVNFKAIEKGNPCTTKSDIYAKLEQNARRIRFIDDWTRPVGLTLFLVFCSPWLFSRAFRGSRKSLA